MGWQNVGQAGEAEHAGDSKEYLCQELGVLGAPLISLYVGQKEKGGLWSGAKQEEGLGWQVVGG